MICNHCGAQLEDGVLFCTSCGVNLAVQQPEQPVQQPAQPYYEQVNQYQQPYQPYGQPYQPYGQPYQPYGQNSQTPGFFQNPYVAYNTAKNAANASLICGISSIFISIFTIGIIFGIVAIVQGNKAKKYGYQGGKATAGIVTGIIGIIIWAIYLFFVIISALSTL